VNGAWKTLSVGEKVALEKGVPHTFRNASDETIRVYNSHQPALNYNGYFEGLHKLAKSSVVPAGQMTFKAMLYQAVLMTRYSDENRLVKPPYPVIQVYGFIGRLLKYEVYDD